MLMSLVAVIWVMHYMRSSTTPTGFAGVLPRPADTFNLCPTRVAWLEFNQMRISEQSNKWLRTDPSGQLIELDPIAVEKWLSTFCSALTQEHQTEATPTDGWQPKLRIGYINGTPQSVEARMTAPEGPTEYQLGHHHFASTDLDEALRTIATLPPAKPPGTP
jgi:hypothetical protein